MPHSSCRSSSEFVVSIALAALALAVPRSAAAVDCGETLLADTVLDRDLTCPGDGLIVGGHGITIDLGGHTITGPGYAGAGVGGVGFQGVTIRNGKLTGFGYGVSFESMRESIVTGLTIGTTQVAMSIRKSDRIRVVSNTIDGTSGSGIFVLECTDSEISSNGVSGVSNGIEVSNASERTLVTRNRISATTWHGIVVGYYSSATVLDSNVVVAPGGDGLVVLGNATGTRLVRNSVTRAGGHGAYVQSDASVTALTANLATRNASDGLYVHDPTATLTRNIAVRNGGYGIDADASVTDGGGNVAASNAAGQCTGITCTAR